MKTDIELLMESPEAMRRFQHALEQAATVIGINMEISKISASLRTQLIAAAVCGLDPSNLLEYCRGKRHERLLVLAAAVGAERGKRLGRARAKEIISEARKFGVLQAQYFPLLKLGVGLNEDD